MSEEHGSEVEIDPNIDLVDTGSKNKIKVAAMLQLQPQKVATTPKQRYFNPLLEISLGLMQHLRWSSRTSKKILEFEMSWIFQETAIFHLWAKTMSLLNPFSPGIL